MRRLTQWSLLAILLPIAAAYAGQNAAPGRSDGLSTDVITDFDGPAPPLAPEVITRSSDGSRATLRAVRIASPLKIDGRLDEEVYRTIPSISDFIQQEPDEGAPATEKTEVWLLFDDANFYVVARCWDSHP